MNKEAWNYSVWRSLSDKLYSESLNHDDVAENGAVHFFETIWKIDDERNLVEWVIDPVQYRDVILLNKNNERYIVPIEFADLMPFKPMAWFECQIKKSDKRKWKFVTEIKSLNITGEAGDMTFKEFISGWNDLEHSEPKHWLLMRMIGIASMHKGVKLGICSAPSFGKNSNFTIMNHVTRDVCRIQKPTLAKFETILYFNRVVLPDEMTSLDNSKIREIEPAILWIGDSSTEYNKHSMAQNKRMNSVDLMEKSLIFTYNRRQDLSKDKPFFDEIWSNPGAFKSRFPQLLLKGVVLEDMKNLNLKEAKQVMEDNFDDIRKMAKAFIYFSGNVNKYMHNYALPDNIKLNNRHKTNLQGLFDVIDAYSDTEEEFKSWTDFVLHCIIEYKTENKEQSEGILYAEEVKSKPITAKDAIKPWEVDII